MQTTKEMAWFPGTAYSELHVADLPHYSDLLPCGVDLTPPFIELSEHLHKSTRAFVRDDFNKLAYTKPPRYLLSWDFFSQKEISKTPTSNKLAETIRLRMQWCWQISKKKILTFTREESWFYLMPRNKSPSY